MKTILGVKGWDLSEYAISANAVLGIRDSGKTYTATEAAEELYDAGVPFIALDPIGVWHSLRIPGKGKGYPVVVAGGRQGDLPLTIKNAGAIVRAAMEAGVSLVLDLFSMELSKADWRRIVRETVEILLHENVDHGVRHIFIEEAAEFVPQRPQDMLVFSAVEKLVRMGGNSKLGCTLINQRSADLNKSVLELCANVFVHRQTGKNTILDLKKWFEMLALDKAEQIKIADSLPDLKSGQCWAFINDLKAPIRLQIPAKNSQHPDRRAVAEKGTEKRKPVPADAFVAQMTAKLAEKDKPKPLAPTPSKLVEKINTVDRETTKQVLETVRREAYALGWAEGWPKGWAAGHETGCKSTLNGISEVMQAIRQEALKPDAPSAPPPPRSLSRAPTSPSKPRAAAAPRPADGLPPPQRRVLASIGFWKSVGNSEPSRAQVGAVAAYSPNSGGFNNLLGQLNTAGLITIPRPGCVALADGAPYDELTADQAREKVLSVLSNPQRKLVDAAAAEPGAISREDLGTATDYSSNSGGFNNLIGELCTLTIFEKPAAGKVCLSDWAREVLG